MNDKPYITAKREDFLDFQELLKKWRHIPFDEFFRLISYGQNDEKPILQTYRSMILRSDPGEYYFLIPIDADEVKLFIECFNMYLSQGEIAVDEDEFMPQKSIELVPREFYLIKDIAQIEKIYPEYLGIQDNLQEVDIKIDEFITDVDEIITGKDIIESGILSLQEVAINCHMEYITAYDCDTKRRIYNEDYFKNEKIIHATALNRIFNFYQLHMDWEFDNIYEQEEYRKNMLSSFKEEIYKMLFKKEEIYKLINADSGTSKTNSKNQDIKALRAEVDRLQARVDALQKENATLQATVDQQAQELEELSAHVVADEWRQDWGFLDDVIKQIESGLSHEDIAHYLQDKKFSRAIIGAVTSKDLARVDSHALRIRADTLFGK